MCFVALAAKLIIIMLILRINICELFAIFTYNLGVMFHILPFLN